MSHLLRVVAIVVIVALVLMDPAGVRAGAAAEEGGKGGQPEAAQVRPAAAVTARLPDLDVRVAAVKGRVTPARLAEIVREATKANVVVDVAGLAAAGVNAAEAGVELDLRDVRVEQLLRVACRGFGGAVTVSFLCEEDLITITTAERAEGELLTLMYPVTDLVVAGMKYEGVLVAAVALPAKVDAKADAKAGKPGRAKKAEGPTVRVEGGEGGGLLGGGGGGGGRDASRQAEQRAEETMTELATLLKETVARESWHDNGGRVGSMRVFAGVMVVTQTAENHRAMARLLGQLRENVNATSAAAAAGAAGGAK